MVLGRLVRHVKGEAYSIIPVPWMTKIFVIGDVFSFMVQGTGGGMLAKSDPDAANVGIWLIIGGLVIQVVLFSFFAVTAVIFHLRIKKAPIKGRVEADVPWEKFMWMLYIASILILFRSVFRLIEYAQGQEGYLLRSEWTLYVFDAALMWLATMFFAWWFPAGIKAVPAMSDADATNEGLPMAEPMRQRRAQEIV